MLWCDAQSDFPEPYCGCDLYGNSNLLLIDCSYVSRYNLDLSYRVLLSEEYRLNTLLYSSRIYYLCVGS